MSLYGLSGALIPSSLKYSDPIQAAADTKNFWPLVAYSIAWRESIAGELAGLWPNALTVVASDNGSGICQVTPAGWWSPEMNSAWGAIDWTNPQENAEYAIEWFLEPASVYWQGEGYEGTTLLKFIAAEYNAGRERVIEAHAKGNVDLATTNGYAAAIVSIYTNLLERGVPN
jgi:hypothetical protein